MLSITSNSEARLSIVHVLAPGDAGGLESVVLSLTSGLHARGHQVGVISVIGQANREPFINQLLAERGVKVTKVELPGRAYGRERAAYRTLFNEQRPDVVHTHGYRPDVLAGPVAGKLGIPRVSTVHGFTGGDWKNRMYEYLQLRAFRHYERVVAVSAPLQKKLEASGLRSGQVTLLPNAFAQHAASLPRSDARAILGIPDDAVVIGWVGRLSQEKGLDVLLEALPRVPPVALSVLGLGRERAALQRQAGELGLSERVRWHGLIPDAARLYGAFDLFVLSSRTEGTPIALFEAMAAEIPIVATAVGGVPDVITDREALLVPSESPSELSRAIASVLGDPGSARARAVAARQRLRERFSVDPWLDRHESMYRELAAQRITGRPS